MAEGKFGGQSTWFLIDGYNIISSKLASLRHKIDSAMELSHGLGDSAEESTPAGLIKAELAQEGAFFDTTAGYSHAAFSAAYPTTPQIAARVATLGFAGHTVGKPFVGYQGNITQAYEVLATRGALTKANVTHTISGQVDNGVILHPLGADTADANTEATSSDHTTETANRTVPITSSLASADSVTTTVPHGLTTGDTVLIAGHTSTPNINGIQTVTVTSTTTFTIGVDITVNGTGGSLVQAKSNNGGYGYIQFTNVTLGGHTAASVTLRHSVDNVTFAVLGTFASITAIGAERITVAGAVNRYLATALDLTGAGSSPTVTYFAGFARNQ
jgi:hypothetical protein